MKRSTQRGSGLELAVGVFVVLGLLAIAMLALKISNLGTIDSRGQYQVRAYFDNIGALKARAPVTVAGVRVGRVLRISFDKNTYQAVVVLGIDKRYNTLPVDTSASILTQGLLGEQYVGLDPGGAPQYLKNGDKITITQSALVLEQIIGQLLFHKASQGAQQPPAPGLPAPH